MSCPRFRGAISSLVTLVNVMGFFLPALTPETKTSSSCFILVVSCTFSCEKEKKENKEKKIEKRNLLDFVLCLNKFSIRKKVTNKKR
jgi:hypothetical protein